MAYRRISDLPILPRKARKTDILYIVDPIEHQSNKITVGSLIEHLILVCCFCGSEIPGLPSSNPRQCAGCGGAKYITKADEG